MEKRLLFSVPSISQSMVSPHSTTRPRECTSGPRKTWPSWKKSSISASHISLSTVSPHFTRSRGSLPRVLGKAGQI